MRRNSECGGVLASLLLPGEEERILQDQVLGIRHALREQISQYAAGEDTEDQLTWLVRCSLPGYQRTLTELDLRRMADLSAVDFGRCLAQVAGRGLRVLPFAADNLLPSGILVSKLRGQN